MGASTAICVFVHLQNVFKDGVVLVLRSEASGKNLRILQDGDVEGRGGEGELGRECVCAIECQNRQYWRRRYIIVGIRGRIFFTECY